MNHPIHSTTVMYNFGEQGPSVSFYRHRDDLIVVSIGNVSIHLSREQFDAFVSAIHFQHVELNLDEDLLV